MPELRLAQPKDVDAVRDCARAAYRKYVERIGREPAPMVADFEAHIRRRQMYVIEDDAGLAGYVVFFRKDDHMFLENVAVPPDRQGNGYGRRLILHAEEEAHRAGLTHVRLYTNVHMRENLGLYKALGYVETGRRREDGFDRVYFEKVLG